MNEPKLVRLTSRGKKIGRPRKVDIVATDHAGYMREWRKQKAEKEHDKNPTDDTTPK